jgi:hypothetical protein
MPPARRTTCRRRWARRNEKGPRERAFFWIPSDPGMTVLRCLSNGHLMLPIECMKSSKPFSATRNQSSCSLRNSTIDL